MNRFQKPLTFQLQSNGKFITVHGQSAVCVGSRFLMATRIQYEVVDKKTTIVRDWHDETKQVTVTNLSSPMEL
jgi:hypothetical protein